VIGYLSRMSASLGLGTLVEAFMKLRTSGKFPNLQLRAMGGLTGDDTKFVRDLQHRLAQHGIREDAEFASDFSRGERLAFLRGLTLMSVPIPGGEAFGTFQLEALAAGVPIVQPDAGAFSEIVDATGGGVCYHPNNSATLASTLEALLLDPDRLKTFGQCGHKAIRETFSAEQMANNMVALYEKVLSTAGKRK